MTKVSVLVPLHNSIKYLDECIESILSQTLRDIEIICIDSSTDGTTSRINDYKNEHPSLKLIYDTNASYGHKLNVGIAAAKGEYIAIVESDDYIDHCMLEKMYACAKEKQVDFVKACYEGFVSVKEKKHFYLYERFVNEQYYNRVIELRNNLSVMPYIGYNIWCAIYNREFLISNGIKFHESAGAAYQDAGFAILVSLLANRVCFMKEGFYKYRMDNEGSSVKSDAKYQCIIDEFVWLRHQMQLLGCDDSISTIYYNLKKFHSYQWNYLRLSREYRDKFIQAIEKDEFEDFDESILGLKMENKTEWISVFNGNNDFVSNITLQEEEKNVAYKKLFETLKKYDEIVIVCAGKCAQSIIKLQELWGVNNIKAICDNSSAKQGKLMNGLVINSVEDSVLNYSEAGFIVANKNANEVICAQLKDLGVSEDHIIVSDISGIGVLIDYKKFKVMES